MGLDTATPKVVVKSEVPELFRCPGGQSKSSWGEERKDMTNEFVGNVEELETLKRYPITSHDSEERESKGNRKGELENYGLRGE
jgi:hypothetical protein